MVVDRKLSKTVIDLARRFHDAQIPGVIETVPTFRTLLIHFDPDQVPSLELTEKIETMLV